MKQAIIREAMINATGAAQAFATATTIPLNSITSIETVSKVSETYKNGSVPMRAFLDSLSLALTFACHANYGIEKGGRWLDVIKSISELPSVEVGQGTLLDRTDVTNYHSTRTQAIKALMLTPGLAAFVLLRVFWLDIQDGITATNELVAKIAEAQPANQTVTRA